MAFEDYGFFGFFMGLAGFGTAIAQYFRGQKATDEKINEAMKELSERIHSLELKHYAEIIKHEVQLDGMERDLAKALVRPHQPEIDAYMIKMAGVGLKALTPEEIIDFRRRMQDVLNSPEEVDKDIKVGYTWYINRINSLLERDKWINSLSEHQRELLRR